MDYGVGFQWKSGDDNGFELDYDFQGHLKGKAICFK